MNEIFKFLLEKVGDNGFTNFMITIDKDKKEVVIEDMFNVTFARVYKYDNNFNFTLIEETEYTSEDD